MFEKHEDDKLSFLTVGTPQCALACALLGAVIAVLFLTIGFGKTLFIALFIAAGLFVGGVKDKGECLRSVTEAVVPRKEVRVYQAKAGVQKEPAAAQDAEGDEEDGEDAGDGEDAEDPEDEEDPEDSEDAGDAGEETDGDEDEEDGPDSPEDGDDEKKNGEA